MKTLTLITLLLLATQVHSWNPIDITDEHYEEFKEQYEEGWDDGVVQGWCDAIRSLHSQDIDLPLIYKMECMIIDTFDAPTYKL